MRGARDGSRQFHVVRHGNQGDVRERCCFHLCPPESVLQAAPPPLAHLERIAIAETPEAIVKSIGSMILQLEPLLDTKDLTPWEDGFVRRLAEISDHGRDTLKLSVNEIGRLVELYRKHFGDAEPETLAADKRR